MPLTTTDPTVHPTARERLLRPLAWASLVANVGIVLTGGAVRLTGSGLGCPTWPRCTPESYVPHGSLGVHGAIEFGNRMLTFVLVAVAVATLVACWRTGRADLRRLSLVLALGIPAQALIGGITVLTDLDPWIVAFHLLVSMAMIGVAVTLVRAIGRPPAGSDPDPYRSPSALAPLGVAVFVAAWAVLYLGTVVTGSGPHAGDLDSRRTGLDPETVSQLHADAVFLLVGLTVALVLSQRAAASAPEARRATLVLLGVELAQGVLGFVQYALDLPIPLVGLHLLGAAAVSASATWVLLTLVRPLAAAGEPTRSDAQPDVGRPADQPNSAQPNNAQPNSMGSRATATKSSER